MVMVVVKCNLLGIFLAKNLKFLIRMAMSLNNVSDIGLGLIFVSHFIAFYKIIFIGKYFLVRSL